MVVSMEIPDAHGKRRPNIYQRRAYAARRALIAIDSYTSLSFAGKSPVEKERALRWMKAWMEFAVYRDR